MKGPWRGRGSVIACLVRISFNLHLIKLSAEYENFRAFLLNRIQSVDNGRHGQQTYTATPRTHTWPQTPSDPLSTHSNPHSIVPRHNHRPHSSTKFNYEINFISLKTQHATSKKEKSREQRTEREQRKQKAKGQANIKPLNIDGQ